MSLPGEKELTCPVYEYRLVTTDNRIVNKLLFSSNYMLSRFKVSTGLFFVAISCVWASLEEEDTADTLIVESETAEYSADVYIKEEE